MFDFIANHRKQILIISSLLVLVIQGLVFLIDDYGDITSDIDAGKNYFKTLIEERFEKLQLGAQLVADDHALKAAATTFNEETVRLALLNHKSRVHADFMGVSNLSGSFFVSTVSKISDDLFQERLRPLIQKLENGSENSVTGIIDLGDMSAYQVTIVPLRAPRTIGYVIVGFLINKQVTQTIKDITSLEISLFTIQNGGESTNDLHVAATTMQNYDLKKLAQNVKKETSVIHAYLSEVIVIRQDNPTIEFLAYVEKPWQDLTEKYYISVCFLGLVMLISGFRFFLKRTDVNEG